MRVSHQTPLVSWWIECFLFEENLQRPEKDVPTIQNECAPSEGDSTVEYCDGMNQNGETNAS